MYKKTAFTLLIFVLIQSILFSARQSEDEFWDSEKGDSLERSGLTQFPGNSFVYAGILGYANFSGREDDYTAGLKISSSLRDYVQYFSIKLDGFLGIGGPVEGNIEASVSLVRGLQAGVGLSYTKRLNFSPRFGLYVEDETDTARRGGLYLLRESSGGIELSWPFDKKWCFYGDFGSEKEGNDKYTRLLAGMLYQF